MPLSAEDLDAIKSVVLDVVRKEGISGAVDPEHSWIDDAVISALGPKLDAITSALNGLVHGHLLVEGELVLGPQQGRQRDRGGC